MHVELWEDARCEAQATFVVINVNDQILDLYQHTIFVRRWSHDSLFPNPVADFWRFILV
jgi:hypothetical protein